MAKKKVTSSDVAKRAGVSQATVSMVLNKVHRLDQDRLDVGTVVFGAVGRDMLGKLVQCHDF